MGVQHVGGQSFWREVGAMWVEHERLLGREVGAMWGEHARASADTRTTWSDVDDREYESLVGKHDATWGVGMGSSMYEHAAYALIVQLCAPQSAWPWAPALWSIPPHERRSPARERFAVGSSALW